MSEKKRKKPSKCNILFDGVVIGTMSTRHYKKIDLFVDEHMKASGHDNGQYRLNCFYCNEPLQWIESERGDDLLGITFCPRCFPVEQRKQAEEFEL